MCIRDFEAIHHGYCMWVVVASRGFLLVVCVIQSRNQKYFCAREVEQSRRVQLNSTISFGEISSHGFNIKQDFYFCLEVIEGRGVFKLSDKVNSKE